MTAEIATFHSENSKHFKGWGEAHPLPNHSPTQFHGSSNIIPGQPWYLMVKKRLYTKVS